MVGLRNDVRWRGIAQLKCEMENVGGGQEARLRIQHLSTNIPQNPFNSQQELLESVQEIRYPGGYKEMSSILADQ